MDKKIRTVVVIPTYNEAQNIESLVFQILHFHPQFDILIVDDNSPDDTGRIAEELSKRSNKIRVLHQARKVGLGRAYIEGFKYILLQEPLYERIIQMDADFSHHPKYLGDLLKATQNSDLSLGSRYIVNGKIVNWGIVRRLISYCANLYVRFFLGSRVKDWTGGFRCFKREVLDSIELGTIKSKGYLFQIEVLYRCLCHDYNVTEIPISFVERKKGRTKLGCYEIWEAILGVPRLSFLNKNSVYK